jgi:hypothetical protein
MRDSGVSTAGYRIRLRKKRRVRPTAPRTFRDLHAAQRTKENVRAGGGSATVPLSAPDAASGSAPQPGFDVVTNHVLV